MSAVSYAWCMLTYNDIALCLSLLLSGQSMTPFSYLIIVKSVLGGKGKASIRTKGATMIIY